jgi:hypothetical protein
MLVSPLGQIGFANAWSAGFNGALTCGEGFACDLLAFFKALTFLVAIDA